MQLLYQLRNYYSAEFCEQTDYSVFIDLIQPRHLLINLKRILKYRVKKYEIIQEKEI